MLGQIMQPKRFWVPDQLAEDSPAIGIGTDALDLLVGETDREEPGDLVVLTDAAHRGVPRIDERSGGLDDPVEYRLELQASSDGQNSLKQTLNPIPRRPDRIDPSLELVEQIVQTQMRQRLVGRAGLAFATGHANLRSCRRRHGYPPPGIPDTR